MIPDKRDKIDVEYCYSGFLGHRLIVFIWQGDTLIVTFIPNEKGDMTIRPGMKMGERKLKVNKALRLWEWLQRRIPTFLEQL